MHVHMHKDSFGPGRKRAKRSRSNADNRIHSSRSIGSTHARVAWPASGRAQRGNRMKFDDLERIDNLVHNVWDAAALLCLEERPLRYTDLGSQMTAWSGRRLSDS